MLCPLQIWGFAGIIGIVLASSISARGSEEALFFGRRPIRVLAREAFGAKSPVNVLLRVVHRASFA